MIAIEKIVYYISQEEGAHHAMGEGVTGRSTGVHQEAWGGRGVENCKAGDSGSRLAKFE